MKKVLTVFFVLLLLVCAVGCIRSTGHYRTILSISNQTSDSFYMKYESFDGEKKYSFSVKENAVLDVDFVTESGKLSCTVTDSDGNEYYKNEDVQTEKISISLGKKGRYSVCLRAEEHKGSFDFTIK